MQVLSHRGLTDVVNQCRSRSNLSDWMAFKLKEKLKILKFDLRTWHTEVFGVLDNIKIKCRWWGPNWSQVEDLRVLDLNTEKVSLSRVEVEVLLYKGFANHWELLRARDSQNYQYSILKWLRRVTSTQNCFMLILRWEGGKTLFWSLKLGIDGLRALTTSDLRLCACKLQLKRVLVIKKTNFRHVGYWINSLQEDGTQAEKSEDT